jgi:hypothetical protein
MRARARTRTFLEIILCTKYKSRISNIKINNQYNK